MIIIIWKLIKLACICIIICYLHNMVGNLVILNISIFAKGVPSWLEKEKQPSWLVKSEHLFAKFQCSKTFNLLLFIVLMLFYGDFTTFGKMCRGVPFTNDFMADVRTMRLTTKLKAKYKCACLLNKHLT